MCFCPLLSLRELYIYFHFIDEEKHASYDSFLVHRHTTTKCQSWRPSLRRLALASMRWAPSLSCLQVRNTVHWCCRTRSMEVLHFQLKHTGLNLFKKICFSYESSKNFIFSIALILQCNVELQRIFILCLNETKNI